MIELDTDAALGLDHGDSATTVRIPLTGQPSRTWRRIFHRMGAQHLVHLNNANGRAWVCVVLQGTETHNANDAVARLDLAVELVALANRRVAEAQTRWAEFDDQLRAWWAERPPDTPLP